MSDSGTSPRAGDHHGLAGHAFRERSQEADLDRERRLRAIRSVRDEGHDRA